MASQFYLESEKLEIDEYFNSSSLFIKVKNSSIEK
jgi:hypothetical protein